LLRRTTTLIGIFVFALSLAGCTPNVATTTTLSASAATISVGQSVTLTAAATAPSLNQAMSGTVVFSDGATALGTVSLTGGRAVLTTAALAPGSRTITARFVPLAGSGYAGSSATLVITVQRFHLALGDSLAAGVGAPAGQGYVPVITAGQLPRLPGLTLRNLSCGGATTASMLNGGGCSYPQGNQLAAAEAFLASHPSAVSFITIDIGANDVSGCVSAAGTDPACAAARLPVVQTNLAQILGRLHAAAPAVPIIGMTYYNPFLAFWVAGNQAAAASSNAGALTFNDALASTYTANSALVAPVEEAFGTEDTALTGTYSGLTVPQNVANICAWTRMCTNSDIHANATGHALIATTFRAVINGAVPSG